MEKKTFRVAAEFSRADETGWVSFEKQFASQKEAEEEYQSAKDNPLTMRASLRVERQYVPRQ